MKTKKLLALLLALVTVISICAPALAETATEPTAEPTPKPTPKPVKTALVIKHVREGFETGKTIAKNRKLSAYPETAYVLSARNIKGYTFKEFRDANGNVIPAEGLQPAENTVVLAVYIKHVTVTVKYLCGKKNVSKAVKLTGVPGTEYELNQKTAKGYTYLETDDPFGGKLPAENGVITLKYGKNVTVTVTYVNQKGKKIVKTTEKIAGVTGGSYTVTPTDIPGYTYAETKDANQGVFGTKNSTVKVVYLKGTTYNSTDGVTQGALAVGTPVNLIACAVDKDTGAIIKTVQESTVKVGGSVNVGSVNMTGYALEGITANGQAVSANQTISITGDTTVLYQMKKQAEASNEGPNQAGYMSYLLCQDPGGAFDPAMADAVIAGVNTQRAAAGLNTLSYNANLAEYAGIRAKETVYASDSEFYSHIRPGGISWETISALTQGENCLRGSGFDADGAMQLWMNSPSHRANILGNYSQIGVACLYLNGNYYCVQHFA